MSTLRKEEKSTVARRLSDGFLMLGIVAILGGLVAVFVTVPVVLLRSARADETPALPPTKYPVASRAEAERKVAAFVPPPAPLAAPAPRPAIDDEGFIRHWLVLAPIPCRPPVSGPAELQRRQLGDESRLRPKADQKVKVSDRELAWKRVESPEFFIDFRRLAGDGPAEDAVAYAVCYLHADTDLKGLRLLMGSNDQAKVYLNGKAVLEVSLSRSLRKDQSRADDLVLRRGENILVFKVVNEKNNWQGCVRLTDSKGVPVRGVRVSPGPL